MTALHGTYRARAVSGGLGYAGNGTEQLAVDFVITEGPNEGQHVTWWGFFSDKAVDRTIESLRICGWKGDDLCDLTGITDNDVDLVIEAEEYEDRRTGEIRSIGKVRWVNRAGGLNLKDAMSPQQAREFAARMRGRVASLGSSKRPMTPMTPAPANNAARRPGAPQPAQAIDPTDDIPFVYDATEFCTRPGRNRWIAW